MMAGGILKIGIFVPKSDFAFGETLARQLHEQRYPLQVEVRDFGAVFLPPANLDFIVLLLTPMSTDDSDFVRVWQTIVKAGMKSRTIAVIKGANGLSADLEGLVHFVIPAREAVAPLSAIRSLADVFMQYGPHDAAPFPRYEIEPAMQKKIADVPFTGRTKSLLRNRNIHFIGDLVQLTEAEFLRAAGSGRKSLNDVKVNLAALGLRLGMDLIGWPPEDFDALERQLVIAQKVACLKQSRGGATFKPDHDRFVMEAHGEAGDVDAAMRPMSRQMQAALHDKAMAFADIAARLDNQPGWRGIARSAANLPTC